MLSRTAPKTKPHSFRELREYFRTLSDGARLRILAYLAESPRDHKVSDLARDLHMSQPLTSWHIRRLVKIGLVRIHRVGREARCSLDRRRLEEFERSFSLFLAEREKGSVIEHTPLRKQ